MSFSGDVKQELLNVRPKRPCCKTAEAYGLLLFGRHFSSRSILLQTENEEIALCYRAAVRRETGAACSLSESEGGLYTVSVSEKDRPSVLRHFRQNGYRIRAELFACEHCRASFLRGAFLDCGIISDPEKEYHLEFVCRYETLAWDLCTLLKELHLDAKMTERRGLFITYLKDSENIEDLLTLMGASNSSLMIMNIKIVKDIRNQQNRLNNFETANIQKTAGAAARHLDAIRRITEAGQLDSLPPELREAAIARRDHFELPLSELGKMLGLSRSGIFHRLDKLVRLAEQLPKGRDDR